MPPPIFAVQRVALEFCETVLRSRTVVTLLQLPAVLSQDLAIVGLVAAEEAIAVEAGGALTLEERKNAAGLDQGDGSSSVAK